jgi:uncharacterized membrane protein
MALVTAVHAIPLWPPIPGGAMMSAHDRKGTPMGAGHAHTPSPETPRGLRTTLAVIIPAAIVIAIAMIWLWPPAHTNQAAPDGNLQVKGVITEIKTAPCPQAPEGSDPSLLAGPSGCGTAMVKLSDGPDAATTIETDLPAGPGAPAVHVGDAITLMAMADSDAGNSYQIADHQRGTQLWLLAAAFALAVMAFGRLRGVTALAGLGVTFGLLLWFIVPAILAGESPLLVAIVGSAAIMLTVLYLTHGLSSTTSVAVIGTLAALALTGILSGIAVAATHLTGVTDDSSIYLQMDSKVNMQGLLLAGIIIGALGVLDDITVTQSVTVGELAAANPGYGYRQLYRAATRVGRAHIASVINTIILAYAGASLPLMLLISQSNTPLGQVLTNQMIAEELVRSIIGTLGLIAAVPITTALAALVASRRQPVEDPDSHHHDHEPRYQGAGYEPHYQGGWEPIAARDTITDRPRPRHAGR